MKLQLNLKYNYVYFNTNYGRRWVVDQNEYNAICLRDLTNVPGIKLVQCPLSQTREWIRKLYCIHTSQSINSKIKLPLQRLWYPLYFSDDFPDNGKKYCFVMAGRELPLDYCYYLRNKYPDCKLVKLHRDLVKVDHTNPEYSEDNMNRIFDLRMSFDKSEAQSLGIPWFDEIESKIDVAIDGNYPLSDVFFAGKAKDRIHKIVKAFDILSSAGLKCDFYITNAPENEKILRDGITYLDEFMPYEEMLFKSVNSRCMLDVNQNGAVGYTSRFLEAVMYNKKLIADNPYMKESKYYNPQFIQYVDNIEDINPAFVTEECEVDYHYNDDFSPIHLIQQIDNELRKRDI